MKTTKEEVSLIEGVFSAEDAKELLLNLFNTKIQFHQMKNFGSNERFGHDDKIAAEKIPKLQQSRAALLQMIDAAQHENKRLKISSKVRISFV